MKILVLNCGSSSIKYQLVEMDDESVIVSGGIDRIGLDEGDFKITKAIGGKIEKKVSAANHGEGIQLILDMLLDATDGVIKDVNEIAAVGHRIVHGAEEFSGSVLLNEDIIAKLEEISELAPLHNPANIAGIKAIQEIMPDTPQCGTFDTAFHQTMPPESYLYAIPYKYYEKYKIRRYGFHGSSHKYVSEKAAEVLGLDYNNIKIITCHLGNGASLAAVKNGKVFDTSMGLTPLEGLIMGTRAGDFDMGALFYLMHKENWSIEEADRVMNKESGLLGLSGVSSDMRDLYQAALGGNEKAQVALKKYSLKVKRYVGAFAAVMGGVDVIVFTGGIGENQGSVREDVCTDMEFLGIEFDAEKNTDVKCKLEIISKPNSKVTVMTIPTDEEIVIARDTLALVK